MSTHKKWTDLKEERRAGMAPAERKASDARTAELIAAVKADYESRDLVVESHLWKTWSEDGKVHMAFGYDTHELSDAELAEMGQQTADGPVMGGSSFVTVVLTPDMATTLGRAMLDLNLAGSLERRLIEFSDAELHAEISRRKEFHR